MERMESSRSITADMVYSEKNGDVLVRSSDGKTSYQVDLLQEAPSCQCFDWQMTMFPCKHMFVVMSHHNLSLPCTYLSSSRPTLDETVLGDVKCTSEQKFTDDDSIGSEDISAVQQTNEVAGWPMAPKYIIIYP